MGSVMRFSCFKSDKVISKIRKMVSKIYKANPWIDQKLDIDKTHFGNDSSQLGLLSCFCR